MGQEEVQLELLLLHLQSLRNSLEGTILLDPMRWSQTTSLMRELQCPTTLLTLIQRFNLGNDFTLCKRDFILQVSHSKPQSSYIFGGLRISYSFNDPTHLVVIHCLGFHTRR